MLEQDRPARVSRSYQGRAGLRQGGAGAIGVGQRLASSERAERNFAGRRLAVRSPGRVRARRGDAQAYPCGQSGEPLRLYKSRMMVVLLGAYVDSLIGSGAK